MESWSSDLIRLFLNPATWGWILAGNLIGVAFGVIPGLNGAMALILLLPLTYHWVPEVSLLFLMGMLGAQFVGGAVPAILLNIPGTSMNAATTFEGYPMTLRGEGARAIGIAAAASAFGGLVGFIPLFVVLPVIRALVLMLGSAELFWIVVLGLTAVALSAQTGQFRRGLIAGGLGMLLSLVGCSSVLGTPRFTLGSIYLWDGIDMTSLFLGIFGITQVIRFVLSKPLPESDQKRSDRLRIREAIKGALDVIKYPWSLLRSAAIGIMVGAAPGIGGTVANFMAYTVEMRISKEPEKFHRGKIEGLIASETANNGKEGSQLIPTLGFGIPGSFEGALILAALTLHGIQPGPYLLQEAPKVIWALIISLMLSQVIASLIVLIGMSPLARVARSRMQMIAPLIAGFILIGTFASRGNVWDVLFMVVAGFLGYFFLKAGYPVVPFIIGFILGNSGEKFFYQALDSQYGSLTVFFRFPAILFAMLVLIVVGFVVWQSLRKRKAEVDSGVTV